MQSEPLVAAAPTHRRSLTGTFLLAVAALLGVVALVKTGTAPVLAGYAGVAARPAALAPHLRAGATKMQIPDAWSDPWAADAHYRSRPMAPDGPNVPWWLSAVSAEEGRRRWFEERAIPPHHIDAPVWGEDVSDIAEAVNTWIEQDVPSWDEQEAKRQWLAEREAGPAWGQARGAEGATRDPAPDVSAALPASNMDADQAKQAWFAKQEAPAWGPGVSTTSEDQAKRKWLADREAEAAWAAAGPAPAQPEVVAEPQTRDPAPAVSPASNDAEQWLAKKKWLAARDEQPAWGPGSQPEVDAEQAKQKWLAEREAALGPVWGPGPSGVPELQTRDPAPAVGGSPSADAAKQAWLAKLDAPEWGQAASARDEVVAEPQIAYDEQERLSQEEEAKQAWLARQDVANQMFSGQMTEEQAKQAWLAQQDNKPGWR